MRGSSTKLAPDARVGYSLYYYKTSNALIAASAGASFGRAQDDLGNAWRYVASTINGTTTQIYVDGVGLTSKSIVSPLDADRHALTIGRASAGGFRAGVGCSMKSAFPTWLEALIGSRSNNAPLAMR